MADIDIQVDAQSLAEAVAHKSVAIMQAAIEETGSCRWVLAGGSTPVLAYQYIADNLLSEVDWSKVTILIGDERIAPLDSDQSNWHQADQALLKQIPQAKQMRPRSNLELADAVDDYHLALEKLPADLSGYPIFDLVWLGIGEDGHTLSLFPGSPNLDNNSSLILPVEDSPKPPSERLTFGLSALRATQHLLVIAAGSSKAEVVASAQSSDELPIAKAASTVEQAGGQVDWLIDEAAGQRL